MAAIKHYSPVINRGKTIHAASGTPASGGAEFGPPKDFGIGLPRALHFKYDFAVDGGAISTITLATGGIIPATAVLVGVVLNSTTAPVGTGATVAFGVLAGGANNTLITATAITSFTLDALVAGAPTFAAPVKMTAAGAITMTIATHALSAGVIEGWAFYVEAANS